MTPVDYAVAVGAGVLTGFVCAVPVGPINVAIMEEGIHSGRTRALIIAVGALLTGMTVTESENSEQRLHPHTMFWTGFVRVLVNPNVLLFWIMISAVLLANGTLQPAWQSRMACVAGAGLGIAAWFTLLVLGSARVRNQFSDRTLVRFSHVSGLLLLLLSVVIAVRLIGTVAQQGS